MLLKRTILHLPAQLLSPLAQFLSVILWTHYCSAEIIGAITLVTVQQELIRTVFIGWWSHYTLRFINDKKISNTSLECTNFGVLFFSSLLQLVFSYFAYIYIYGRNGDVYYLCSIVCFIVFRSINQHNITLAAAKYDAASFNVLSLSGPVLGLFIGVGLLNIYKADSLYPLIGYAIGESFGVFYSLLKVKRVLSPFKIDKCIFLDSIKYSMPILFSGALAWLTLNLSRYVIDYKLGLAAVGSYSVGFGLGQRAASLAAMLVTSAALPTAIGTMQTKGMKAAMMQLSQNFTLLIAVMFPALVGMYSVKDLIVTLLVATEFWSVTLETLPWAIFSGGCLAIIYNYLNHYFIISNRTKYLIVIDASLAMLTFVFSSLLVGYLGIKGGVIAMCLSSALVCFLLLIYLLFKTEFIFPWYSFFYTILSVSIMYLVITTLRIYLESYTISKLLELIMSILSGLITYALLVFYRYRSMVVDFFSFRESV